MPDQRYAPPNAAVKDVAHERVLAQRPAQVKAAVIALWVTLAVPGIPMAAYEYQRAAALAPGAAIFSLAFMLVMFTISAVLTFYIGRGRNWARIAYLLLFGLSLFVMLGTFGEMLKSPGWLIAGTVINTLIDFAVLAVLFFGPGGRWFRQMRE
jgi:hypothetical protein